MRVPLTVTADATGVPSAQVPCTSMWDLVEYLSYQRVSVTYQYQASHFIIAFPHQDLASAQRVLDEWVRSSNNIVKTSEPRNSREAHDSPRDLQVATSG